MSQTVAEVLVDVLERIGVKQVFGLIGDSLNPLGDAVRKSNIEWIGVRHEEGAALAASGQAKLTGRLAVCAGTTGPGSNHLVAGLYEASRDHAPVLALSGEMPRKMKGMDFFQSTEPDLLFRDLSLYTQTIISAAQAPGVIHQAIAAAYAGPGVAHLTLPQDVLSAKAEGAMSSVATLRPRAEVIPNDVDIDDAAKRIDAASSVVIMCGAGCRGVADLLRALSDRLKAPLVHTVRGKEIMNYEDPRWMGGLGMIGTKPVYHAVQRCELLVMIGTDYPYSNFLPAHGTVIQIDERPLALGRRTPTVLGITGSARPAIERLLEKTKAKADTRFFNNVTHERHQWDEMLDKQADLTRSRDKLHPQAVARAVSDLAAPDATFVFDTGLNTLWSGNWIRQNGTQRIIGSFNNAAVGTSLGQANGVQALDRTRQVIALTGDGGFNMLMGEFMTAVHHKLPIKVVIFNNSALGLITLEAESVGILPFRSAIEFPNPDFAALARACGAHGFTVKQPGVLTAALREAFACDGPAIVDCVVAPDEMPNMPHIELEQVGNYALAKIKEAVHAVTGG
ncbi:thiamine pyrophosphate-dependent enzyme [Bradyrhizobium canariense]|uniref:Pyruvate dehydrogenase (Quinone)/pyruvate oxidase n=1 Tax=Bradyrhizobium canariense TaxID=255045 RepID=A0A1H1UG21_9BRAD|nr:thiamine pyrophosphate-dependent enzyme [Bradyrhizobium canariense]SDS71447.1 pyruvate dehydrogenase (quinone)/pyruvate oxidase [Bradyrhizobium canariense]